MQVCFKNTSLYAHFVGSMLNQLIGTEVHSVQLESLWLVENHGEKTSCSFYILLHSICEW